MILLDILALFAVATLFGGMVAFAFFFAPLVFTQLPLETASGFIRAVFPWYYLAVFAAGLAAAAAMAARSGVLAALLLAIALAALAARQILMPQINAARDAERAGDGAAGATFKRLHGMSVALNVAQMAGAAVALASFASRGS